MSHSLPAADPAPSPASPSARRTRPTLSRRSFVAGAAAAGGALALGQTSSRATAGAAPATPAAPAAPGVPGAPAASASAAGHFVSVAFPEVGGSAERTLAQTATVAFTEPGGQRREVHLHPSSHAPDGRIPTHSEPVMLPAGVTEVEYMGLDGADGTGDGGAAVEARVHALPDAPVPAAAAAPATLPLRRKVSVADAAGAVAGSSQLLRGIQGRRERRTSAAPASCSTSSAGCCPPPVARPSSRPPPVAAGTPAPPAPPRPAAERPWSPA